MKTPEQKLAKAIYDASPERKKYLRDNTYKRNERPDVKKINRDRAKIRRQAPANKELRRKYALTANLRKYDLTRDQYEKMLIDQCGCCALCGKQFKNFIKEPQVDHCHQTGKVRGLLHSACNVGLGQFQDSINMLEAAIKYLVANNGN